MEADWDFGEPQALECIQAGQYELRIGDRVRICPRARADIFDLVLAGKCATIASIERDFEDRVHLALTIDDDPGADFGEARMIGHRFFFAPEEVEPLPAENEL